MQLQPGFLLDQHIGFVAEWGAAVGQAAVEAGLGVAQHGRGCRQRAALVEQFLLQALQVGTGLGDVAHDVDHALVVVDEDGEGSCASC